MRVDGIPTCLKCLLLGVLISTGYGDARAGVSRLSIAIEDSPALQYQTLYVVICLENNTQAPVRDLAPLSPGKGFLQFTLLRQTGGSLEPISRRGPAPTFVAREAGPSLAAGETICDARDLLVYFGEVVDDSVNEFSRLRWPSLTPGRYSLVARYALHSGFDRTIPQQTLSTDTLNFEVRPVSAEPPEERLLRGFLSATAQYGSKTSDYFVAAREWLPRFYQSHFLLRMFRECGPEMSRISTATLLDDLKKRNVSPTKRAALIGIRARIDPRARERDPHIQERLRSHAASDIERRMIDSWENY